MASARHSRSSKMFTGVGDAAEADSTFLVGLRQLGAW
jgi:hypothetical protein